MASGSPARLQTQPLPPSSSAGSTAWISHGVTIPVVSMKWTAAGVPRSEPSRRSSQSAPSRGAATTSTPFFPRSLSCRRERACAPFPAQGMGLTRPRKLSAWRLDMDRVGWGKLVRTIVTRDRAGRASSCLRSQALLTSSRVRPPGPCSAVRLSSSKRPTQQSADRSSIRGSERSRPVSMKGWASRMQTKARNRRRAASNKIRSRSENRVSFLALWNSFSDGMSWTTGFCLLRRWR